MSTALAAAALVTIGAGMPAPPDDVVEELITERGPIPADERSRAAALAALGRAEDPDQSELRALWSEAGLLDEFRAVVAGIRSALQSTVA